MSDPQEPITVTTRVDQGAALISLTGELDLHSSGVLGEAMDEVLAASPAPSAIDVDASGLSFADSAGLRALLVAHNDAGQRGVTLRLTRVSDQLDRLLEMTGLRETLAS